MSQQPPEWWSRQRGPRFGCADVTIVSIASIVAFVVLIFVLLRPDFARVVDVPGGNGNATVGAVRATETPGPPVTARPSQTQAGSGGGVVALVPPTATIAVPVPTAIPVTPTPPPTPSFRRANIRAECRMRQDSNFEAVIIQVFKSGTTFKIYTEQRPDKERNEVWSRVEPDDGTNRQGWMVLSCFS